MGMLNDDGHQATLAWSDEASARLESLQFELGEGPCLDAYRERRPVLVPDVALVPKRWPVFVPAAVEAGVAAVFAFPLQVGAIRLGVLDLYLGSPGGLGDEQLRQALAYADASTTLLLHLQGQMHPGDGLHPEVSGPLEDRAEIHQATGVISVQAAVGLAEALLLLRARAYSDGGSMLETAREVISGTLRFEGGNNEN